MAAITKRSKFRLIFAIVFATAGMFALAVAGAAPICSEVLVLNGKSGIVQIAPKVAKRPWTQIQNLKVMTYNVENLVWHVGKYERTYEGIVQSFENNRGPQEKPKEKLAEIRQIILEESPDIAVLQEVESIEALENLALEQLAKKYQSFLISGNDERGMNIGFLVKTDLPIYVEYVTNKDVLFKDPANNFKETKLFSRDLPVIMLRTSEKSSPFMIVFGNHAKSQRDRPGDPKSIIMRTIQYKKIAEIMQNYHQKYPDATILLAGDYNTDGLTAKELEPLRNIMPSAFEVLSVPPQQQITQTYHPVDRPTVYARLDDIRILSGFTKQVKSIKVVEYKYASGKIRPPARTFEERSTQPSDHRAVVAEIYFEIDN
jgi:endonuclease/exonuclease/phosphatase family metal-dependent hydrolase